MQSLYKDIRLQAVTSAIAIMGTAGLALSGQLNPLMLAPSLGILYGYYRVFKGRPPLSSRLVGALSLITLLILAIDGVFITRDFFIAIAHMTIAFQAIKSFDLREPWDYLQVYFMSLIQIVILSELSHSITVGVVFSSFLATLVIANVMSHFIYEGTIGRVSLFKPAVFISLMVFSLTVVLFVITPRVGSGFTWRKAQKGIKSVGFSERVNLGSFGEVLLNPEIVMRVELPKWRESIYLKGGTLDYFDGSSWSYTIKRRLSVFREGGLFIVGPYEPSRALTYKIYAEPLDTDIVFGIDSMVAFASQEGRFAETDSEGMSFLPAKRNRLISYTAYSEEDLRLPVKSKERYLQLPDGMGRIEELARKITLGSKSPLQRALSIEKYLKANYTYSLSTEPPPPDMSVIDYFLFNSKKGFCEHYSTSMALMLRTIGIPSRIVTGFYVGNISPAGEYVIVRQSNAHSWVEAEIDGSWRRFDPTPASIREKPSGVFLYLDSLRLKWYRYVIGFSAKDQRAIAGALSEPFEMPIKKIPSVPGRIFLYIVITFALVWFLILLPKRIRRISPETSYYLRFLKRVKKHGGNIGPHSTSHDVLREALRLGWDRGIDRLITIYEEVRFGGRPLGAKERTLLQRLSSCQPNSPTKGTKTHGT